MFLICAMLARRNAKRRHLSATAGYIGEARGAEASEKAAELSAKQVRGEIHQHVAVIDPADLRDVRKNFAPDGDTLLNDPCAVLCEKRIFDRCVPGCLIIFPSEIDTRSAVIIARLQ